MPTAVGKAPKSDGDKRRVHQLPVSSCLRGEHNQRNKSSLQFHLERVLKSGGIGRILQLVRAATDREVDEVNASAWTPLVGAIFLLGKDTMAKGNTAESEERLLQLVGACHRRGISLNSSAWFGGRLHRALTVAAYYGYRLGLSDTRGEEQSLAMVRRTHGGSALGIGCGDFRFRPWDEVSPWYHVLCERLHSNALCNV